jgi:hypothetical protein
MNSKIQKIKVLARGFRNRERFRMAIYFISAGSISIQQPSPYTSEFHPPDSRKTPLSRVFCKGILAAGCVCSNAHGDPAASCSAQEYVGEIQ